MPRARWESFTRALPSGRYLSLTSGVIPFRRDAPPTSRCGERSLSLCRGLGRVLDQQRESVLAHDCSNHGTRLHLGARVGTDDNRRINSLDDARHLRS